ncbi:MAG: DUF4320 family protein [Clostridia bacterium]
MRKILKDKRGISQMITSLVGLFTITIMLVISLTFIRVANMQSVLNEFANQMIITTCDYGTTSGDDIDDRYDQLVDSLQIEPTMTYSASYISGTKVQYGDLITVTATVSETINILGIEFPFEFESTKTGRSNWYWKTGAEW